MKTLVALISVFLITRIFIGLYQVPSGSMLPTLEVGDFITVNKFEYDAYIPFTKTHLFNIGEPERGDVIVFRYPPKPSLNYVKRVIGLPGDTISYSSNHLTINGRLIEMIPKSVYPYVDFNKNNISLNQFEVNLSNALTHQVLLGGKRHDDKYGKKNTDILVPQDHYFVMGDNRDYSSDSRIWGFVPKKSIIGKASSIWFHLNAKQNQGVKLERIGEIN